MKIALAQTNVTIGAFESTMNKIKHMCQEAKGKGCQLICFPELALTGYPPKDLLERKDFLEKAERSLEILKTEISGIAVLVGTITINRSGRGKPLFNSAVLFEDGTELVRIHKQLLPTYDVFDEARYFRPGPPSEPVPFKGYSLGITICEDIWNEPDICITCETYDSDPVSDLIEKGAQIIINISSSPFFIGKPQLRHDYLSRLSKKFNIPILYCNNIGGQDCLIFDGGSFAVSSDGRIFGQAKDFDEDLLIVDVVDNRADKREIALLSEEQAAKALVLALRDYTRRCNISKVALGLSGGIDSCLCACLAVMALGKENVLGVIMPSEYTSPASIEDAEELAKGLGIETITIPIIDIFKEYLKELAPVFSNLPPNVAEENLQARIRGNILMAISNKLGHMVISTGNKSEMAVGYCTLYGDMSGGYALISDLPKTFVYKVAGHVNKRLEAIPQRVFTKPPSAELRPDQKDQDDLPPYETLDRIVELYMEKRMSPQDIVALGIDEEAVKRVTAMIDKNEYKRLQAPIGPKVTPKAFCCGRRYPVAHGFRPF